MRIYRVRIRVSKYYDAVFDFESCVSATSIMASLAKRLNQNEEIGAEPTQIYLEVVDPKQEEDPEESAEESNDESDQ